MLAFNRARILWLGVIAALLLAACGRAPGAQQPGPTATPVGITELVILIPDPGPMKKQMDELVSKFEQTNPTIKVTPKFIRSAGDIASAMRQQAANQQTAPAMTLFTSSDLYDLLDAGAVLPLDDCISRLGGKAYLDDFYPALLRNSQVNGKYWGIPFYYEIPVLYYNQAAFKEVGLDPERPPKTWDELVDYAQKLTKRQSADLDPSRWGVVVLPSNEVVQGLAITAGKNLIGDDPTQVAFDQPALVDALQFMLDLSNKHKVMPSGPINSRLAYTNFITGKSAMMIETSGALIYLVEQAKFPLGLGFLPAKQRQGGAAVGADLYLLKGATQAQQNAACKFMQYLTTPDLLAAWSSGIHAIAARKSAYNTAVMKQYLAAHPQAAVPRDQLDYAERELTTYGNQDVQRILGNAITEILRGTTPPDEALRKAQEDADKVLDKWR